MDFFLAMSIFSSAPDLAREKEKAQEWMRAPFMWGDGKGKGAGAAAAAAATDQGISQQQKKPREQAKRSPGGLRFAPELDGLDCFEAIVPC